MKFIISNRIITLLWVGFLIFIAAFIISRAIKIVPSYIDGGYCCQSLAKGIDFTKPSLPTFVDNIEGFAGEEPWGRWTDATKSRSAKIKFRVSLPRKFTLVLNAHAFGPNTTDPTIIRITSTDPNMPIIEKKLDLHSTPKEYRLDFSIKESPNANIIEIIPPHPIAPHTIDAKSDDYRLIGVGLSSLKITSNSMIKNAD